MRALAVVAVVAYHAGVPDFSGGFVGVDVFFVISGYLITGLLVREVEASGRLSIAGFYGRRARRLLPVAALVSVVTVAVGWLVLSPLAHRDLAGDALATSTYTINLRLAVQQLDYLHSSAVPSAFQQFWSLAVEEQFYLVWPLLLLVAARGRLPRRRAAVVVAAVTVLSFVASIVLTHSSPPWAFFSLGTRAWELGAGALLALAWLRLDAAGRVATRAAGQVVGLLLIVGSVVGFSASTPWPGWWAVVPTAGALLVLAGPPADTTRAGRVLASGPLVWVGVRSYSWYLWHWPAIVFVAVELDHDVGGWPAVVAGVATLALAHVTYTWVEQPVRRAPGLVSSPRRSVLLGLGVTASLACLFAVVVTRPVTVIGPGEAVRAVSERPIDAHRLDRAALVQVAPSNLVPTLADAYKDIPATYDNGCHLAVEKRTPRICAYGDAHAHSTVVLFGDSHAAQWVPALDALGRREHFRLVPLTKSGCPAADLTVHSDELQRAYRECDEWRHAVIALVGELQPDLTIVSNTSHYELEGEQGPPADAAWVPAIQRTLTAVVAEAPTVLLADTPYPGMEVPECVVENLTTVTDCTVPRRDLHDLHFSRLEEQGAEAADVTLVPSIDLVCGRVGCPVIVGNLLVYRDNSHLTATYAEHLAPRLGDLLAAAGFDFGG